MKADANHNNYLHLLVIVLGFLVIYLIYKNPVFVYISLGLGIISLLSPVVLDYIIKGWFLLGKGLGYINSRIILTVLFFLILFPLSLIFKLMTKNSLNLKDDNYDSLFTNRNHMYTDADLENPW